MRSNLKTGSKFVVSNFSNYSRFHGGYGIQVHMYGIYFAERVLGAVLRDDRDVSPHPHVSRVVN
jgi:hypothetical protein